MAGLSQPGGMATYKIVEATDEAEFTALTDGQRYIYQLIISLGVADLSEGTKVRTQLFAMFPEGSVTRANLLTL